MKDDNLLIKLVSLGLLIFPAWFMGDFVSLFIEAGTTQHLALTLVACFGLGIFWYKVEYKIIRPLWEKFFYGA